MAMRLSMLNSLTLGTLLAMTLASGGVILWQNRQVSHWETRIALAQESYAEHLALRSNITGLFKQHGDALLFGDRDLGMLEGQIERAIAVNITRIRAIIAAEVALVGKEEAEELDHLARIEAKVQSLTQTLRVLSSDGSVLSAEVRREQMIELMDRETDDRLSARITEALAEERAEVDETRAEAAAFGAAVRRMVVAFSVLSVLATAAAVLLYHRFITAPSRHLMTAVTRYELGDFATAPEPEGVTELRQIGVVLGRMAALLRIRQSSQAEQTRALEDAVAGRTAEVSRMLAQVEQGERSRRRMMADVSHELRTPLTVILGEADVTLRAPQARPEDYREALGRIRETARHANAIVDDLLLIARQEAGKLRLELSDVDLGQLAARTAELAQRPVAVDLPATPARARVDPVRIRQCLLALLQNAIRYGGAGIRLSVERQEGFFRIQVEDDGPGMSDTEKAEAFQRFFRGPNAAATGIDGTGLGLPIVRAIAQAHGGTADIGDRPGGGLRVWIDLPTIRPLALVAGSAA
ncbi:MAG: ATP-binding protein [Gemmobacter sp.]